MIEPHELVCVVTIIKAVGNCNGRGWFFIVNNAMVCHLSVVDDADVPEAVVGVAPSLEDDCTV